MTELVIYTWGHLAGALAWAGGWVVFSGLILPALLKNPGPVLKSLSFAVVRFLTYAGVGTLFFGMVLITKTRGFQGFFEREWGLLITACFLIALWLLLLGEIVMRPIVLNAGKKTSKKGALVFGYSGCGAALLAVALMVFAHYSSH